MAKKKKNIAANPARGFSTTSSVPSKNRTTPDTQSEANTDTDKPYETNHSTSAHLEHDKSDTKVTNDANTADSERGRSSRSEEQSTPATAEADRLLRDLSPSSLEARLADAELQTFVDNHSARCTRDASRTIARLRTERRLIVTRRREALRLDMRRLLGDELLDRIVRLAREEIVEEIVESRARAPGCGAVNKVHAGLARGKRGLDEETALARLWTLQKALLELEFAPGRVGEALAYAVKTVPAGGGSMADGEVVWALDECLEWMALCLDEKEFPDFEALKHGGGGGGIGNRATAMEGDGNAASTPSSGLSDTEYVEPSPRPQDQNESKLDSQTASNSTPGRVETQGETQMADEESSGSELESDLEPEDLLSIYVDTKARLYELQPELVEALATKRKAGQAGQKQSATSSTIATSPKARQLLEKLQRIESDVLFDRQTAEERWVRRRNQVAQDVAERRKLERFESKVKGEPPRSAPGTSTTTRDADAEHQDGSDKDRESEDDGGALQSLFGSVAVDDVGASDKGAGNADGTVEIVDFGKISGLKPRQILEEACRARDSRVQLTYRVVSQNQNAFASRQAVTIQWKKAESEPMVFPLELANVSSMSKSNSCTFTMQTIATTDVHQSEAYVSVVALFQIFSTAVKEGKVHMRLPAVWRNLWSELAAQRKSETDAADKENVRQLREIYTAVKEAEGNFADSVREDECDECDAYVDQRQQRKNGQDIPLGDTNGEAETLEAEQRIKDIWSAKSSAASYQRMLPGRERLPIAGFRDSALAAIEEKENQVTIICGETGCGKSTQLPSFILEQELRHGRDCRIFCTQPRRISAITLARRVSAELGEAKADLGTARSLVGYAIRLESRVVAATRLIYATTGILLRMLESKDGLKHVTHLVIDEVHERSIETDFLLIILKTLVVKRPELKVVLMSATVNASRFSDYFGGAPILNVPGRTFPVETRFLEDAIELTGHVIEDGGGGGYDDDDGSDEEQASATKDNGPAEQLANYSAQTRQTLKRFNEYRIDYNLIVSLIIHICTDPEYHAVSHAVLVFLPGLAEIRQLSDMLNASSISSRCIVHALHSAIPSDDQQRAFATPPPGTHKLVLATNLAETGITIPDVTCVIDTGKHKEMRFDERRQVSRLQESFISRANAAQRRGRAGRVQTGLSFHLFTRVRHDTGIPPEQTPEMLRLSLQDLVMRVKVFSLGDAQRALAAALDPPSARNVHRAIHALVDVGALTASSESLTPLGRRLVALPLDPYLGKLVLYGVALGCLDIALTLAAILTSKTPWVARLAGGVTSTDAVRAAFATANSDLLTDYAAYAAWRRVCTKATARTSGADFCRANGLSPQALATIEDLKAQLLISLTDAGLATLTPAERSTASRVANSSGGGTPTFVPTPTPVAHAAHPRNAALASAIVAAAFYPKLLVRDDATGKGGWRSVATGAPVSLHRTSVLRSAAVAGGGSAGLPAKEPPQPVPRLLSFYSVSGGSKGHTAAQQLTPAAPVFVALLAGAGGDRATVNAVAGTLSLDGGRVRFAVVDGGGKGGRWKGLVALKVLRSRIAAAMAREKGRERERDREWWDVWEEVVARCCDVVFDTNKNVEMHF